MRLKRTEVDMAEGDMTPMIDMTFQLIAFFMVLINFAQTEANDNVVLPNSRLVKPPEVALEFPIILHVGADGRVFLGGDDYTAETLRIGLDRELAVIRAEGKAVSDANVVIRGHKDVAAGEVQEIIRVCQDSNLENFALRVKEDRS
ncbi:ExbD/TolR family protein [Rhodopirellula europaea]|uniref:Biopolymer transport protein ExbD/TolR n=1 Tax=Rhodopirellula europaea 6C TaxID=1263867 RepID=M2AYV7_9BACT|nr:biopolymer transporter ExbD [Rhodopirellula europaea]EMB14748.1 Biopolymer transport protein ExbD/TolR [Rhodopirellula europaea 6C]